MCVVKSMRGKLAPNISESTAVPVASMVSGYRPPPLPLIV